MTDFDLTHSGLDPTKSKDKIEEDKTIIGSGKSLIDLRKDAQLSQVKLSAPISTKTISKEDPSSNKPNTIKINHADNLINLLSSNFANSRERAIASNKIRKYFDSLDK